MKRDISLLLSSANYLIFLLDTSSELWEKEIELKQQLQKIYYLKKQNDKEIIAACEQIQQKKYENT